MKPSILCRTYGIPDLPGWRLLILLWGLIAGTLPVLNAQESPVSGLNPVVPALPSRLESPSLRHGRASQLIDRLSRSDASFEVIVGQSRTLTLGKDLQWPEGDAPPPSVAVSDPQIADVLVAGNRQLRVLGKRVGITDLTISTGEGEQYTYEVHVVLDLQLLEARLLQLFPDASIRLAHLGAKLIVEGEARDAMQLARINQVLEKSVSTTVTPAAKQSGSSQRSAVAGSADGSQSDAAGQNGDPLAGMSDETGTPSDESPDSAEAAQPVPPTEVLLGSSGAPSTGVPQQVEVINLMRIPGPQQVMLMVQIAELNRTAYRQVGSDLLFGNSGSLLGTRMIGATGATGSGSGSGVLGTATSSAAGAASPVTAFGVFEGAGFQAFLAALRRNSVLKILAEPNLVAMHGHRADFLAGGEFPVPVPQSGAGGGTPTVTIEYKKFGVQLAFVPYVIDGDLIRMEVDPEVSSIDFSMGTELSGVRVPGLNTRRSHTTVEMREGQTLAIAGLMQVELAGTTRRIPGMGDLPYIGPFFSNNTGERVEKELVVLVTPHLVEAIRSEQVGPLPGAEFYEPNDLEFYLLNRIEGHTGHAEFRSTVNSEDPLGCYHRLQSENRYVHGPHGFSD
ncbi:MAG: Type secretion system protein precursor [Planctomycetota bacterium]|jgi:pilus assembly protein CpaC